MKREDAASQKLWAITSYYNPSGYRRRRENYRVFRERLSVPLVAVELSFNGRFELQPGDAEILIQLSGGDVMWQKERLLNVAERAVPAACTKVAVLDCDVVFVRPDWAEGLSRLLDDVPYAQPFATVHYIPADMSVDDPQALKGDYTRRSLPFVIESGVSAVECLQIHSRRRPGSRACGHATAMRREVLARGFYDACIIGGGDTAFVAAALGVPETVIGTHCMSAKQKQHYLEWAGPMKAAVGGQVGYVPGDAIHLWHGDMKDRRSPQRYHDLARHNFNPYEDITLDASGCWRWNSDKPSMHECLREYFSLRQEDGPAVGVVSNEVRPAHLAQTR